MPPSLRNRSKPTPTPPPAKKNPIAKSQAKTKEQRQKIGKAAAEKQAQRDQDKVTTEADAAVDQGNNVLAYDWHAEYSNLPRFPTGTTEKQRLARQ